MKHKIFSIFLIFSIGLISQNALAQQNYVYDGEAFNVWLKTNDDNTKVIEVYFTANNQWNKFNIIDYKEYTDADEGFAFEVEDGAGRIYWVDYYRDKDFIVVTDDQDKETWTLHRREN